MRFQHLLTFALLVTLALLAIAARPAAAQTLGAEYTTYREPAGVPLGYPRALGDRGWKNIPWPSVDAAFFFRENGFVYLFRSEEYIKVDPKTRLPVAGYPKKVGVDGWLGKPKGGFDAVLQHGSKPFVYFFVGDKYWRFDIAKDHFEPTPRRLGVDGWFGVFKDGVDAALYHPANDKYYFFKGNRYLRYDASNEAVDPGYPLTLGAEGWRDVRADITAAVELDGETFDFFHPPTSTHAARGMFNHPDGSGEQDAAIHDWLKSMLSKAVPGSRVWLSVPGWNRSDMATAVVDAYERGVEVRIVANGWGTEWFHVHAGPRTILEPHNQAILRFWRGDDPGLDSLGFEKINHAKYALFEDAGPCLRHVSYVSSSNWRTRDRQRQNSGVVIENDERVYAELESLAERVHALSSSAEVEPGDWHRFGKTAEMDRTLEIHVTPSVTGKAPRDPHLELLRDVRCTSHPPFVPTDEIVWVAASTWKHNGRGKAILEELVRIREDGCDVRILGDGLGPDGKLAVKPEDDETSAEIFALAGGAGIRWGKTWSHSKYIVVDAPLQSHGGKRRSAVAVGALNLTGPITVPGGMLEVGFTFFDHPVADEFERHWLWLCSTAVATSGGSACAPKWKGRSTPG